MEKWFESHKFPYIKMENGAYFWQTNVATGEMTAEGKIIWHEKNFFEKVQKTFEEEEENKLFLSIRKMKELENRRGE